MISRRTVLAGVAASALARPGFASAWPTKPVRIVVPFPAGGPTDFIVRLLTPKLSEILGQTVLVDNRAGASGYLGNQAVVDGPADGYTLVHNTVGVQAINPLMYPDSRFNPQRDLVGVATTATMPNVLVVNPAKIDVKSLKELVELGRQAPDKLSCANFGNGTSAHIYGSLLQKVGGFKATEVSYRGSAQALNDVVSGQVDFLFDNMTTCVSFVRSGKLRGLAITAPSRSSLLPDVPTMAEAGLPAVDLKFWFALLAPARTPPEVVARLQEAIGQAMADPEFAAGLHARGAEPLVTPPARLAAFLTDDSKRWADAARQIGVKPQE